MQHSEPVAMARRRVTRREDESRRIHATVTDFGPRSGGAKFVFGLSRAFISACDTQNRADAPGLPLDCGERFARLRGNERGHAALQDACLLCRDLPERVAEMLQKDTRVRGFRLGAWNEGGAGVTLAEFA